MVQCLIVLNVGKRAGFYILACTWGRRHMPIISLENPMCMCTSIIMYTYICAYTCTQRETHKLYIYNI